MQTTIETPPDFDFLECLQAHGWRRLPPFHWVEETQTLVRIEEFTPGEVARIAITAEPGRVSAASDRDVPSAELTRRIRHMLQLDIPMDRFHAYCAEHPELSHIPGLRQGRLLRSPTLFEDLLKVIATTNTTWSQTIGMSQRLVENFGSPVSPASPKSEDARGEEASAGAERAFPLSSAQVGRGLALPPDGPTSLTLPESGDAGLRAFPRPDQIAAVPLDEFSAAARMGYRNQAVHRVSTDIAEGRLDLESWQDPDVPSPDLYKRLLSLPGVGPYAASCLMIYLGRYDRVNVDSWARMMVGKELGRPVTDKEVHAFFEPYGDWKALVYHFYKWKEEEPAY